MPDRRRNSGVDAKLRDSAVDVAILTQERVAEAYYDYDRYRVRHRGPTGETSEQSRMVLHVGRVAAVITVDVAREEIVLLRQFRLAAHLATGRGEMVEIVAGGVEDDEDFATAARRECIEEIGLAPDRLVPLIQFMPAPGVDHELATLFLAAIDASHLPERGGHAGESEEIVPFSVPIDEALAALAAGTFVNGYTVIALQWLALNRHRLNDLLHPPAA